MKTIIYTLFYSIKKKIIHTRKLMIYTKSWIKSFSIQEKL